MIISHKALEVLMFTRRLYLVSVGNVKSRFFSTEVPVDLRGCVVIHKCSTLAQAVVIPLRQKFHWLTSLKKKKNSLLRKLKIERAFRKSDKPFT